MIKPFSGPKYGEFRVGLHEHPCVICGRPVKPNSKTIWLCVVNGGASFSKPSEADENDPGFMGGFPIGPDCWRQHKDELKQFVEDL